MQTILKLAIALLIALTSGCSEPAKSPEDEIREFIAAGVAAAEDRDAGTLKDMVTRDYRDRRGYDREQIGKLLRLYFFRHKNIHLFYKIREINLIGREEARVTLHAAMAGQAITSPSLLSSLRARIYRFELDIVKDDVWRVRGGEWSPASASDLQ
jgi:hypothetical protein